MWEWVSPASPCAAGRAARETYDNVVVQSFNYAPLDILGTGRTGLLGSGVQ